MVARPSTRSYVQPIDFAMLQALADPRGLTSPSPTSAPDAGGGDELSFDQLPEDKQQELNEFVAANQNQFDGAVDTPDELKKLMQMLHMGEGKNNKLPKLDTKPGQDIGNMSSAELLQMLADYFGNFGAQNQNQPPARDLGNLNRSSGGGSSGGGGMSGGGGSGGGGVAPTNSSGPATPSTKGAQGTADVAGAKNLSAEQKKNAQTIIDVGHQKGASERDIQIALMTAMQESGLKNLNYGDRDSVGLFQQRPSCGWGTVAQCTNPEYAAGKFYDHLLSIGNRDSMSLTQAAQKVQVSAFPDAYAKWEGVARGLIDELDAGGGRRGNSMNA